MLKKILKWWNNESNSNRDPMIGDIIGLKQGSKDKWFYVVGKSFNKIQVGEISDDFNSIFSLTIELDVNENNFIFVGSPNKSPLKLDDQIMKHSKTVKKNWRYELNLNKKLPDGWYLDGPN